MYHDMFIQVTRENETIIFTSSSNQNMSVFPQYKDNFGWGLSGVGHFNQGELHMVDTINILITNILSY